MKKIPKQNVLFLMRSFFFIILICLITNQSFALKPVRHLDSMIMLEIEHPDDGYRTYYKAVVSGAEMWLNQYYDLIMNYIKTPGRYYAVMPTYGNRPVRVTARKLTSLLRRVPELRARGWQPEVSDILRSALLNDHWYGHAKKSIGDLWDPISDWKWRSIYMEDRLNTPYRQANCFGTADYLTKGWEWVYAYPVTSEKIFAGDSKFPWITLFGSEYESDLTVHSIDREFKGNNFKYRGSGERYYLWRYINAFDIIRFGGKIGNDKNDLILPNNGNQINLGKTYHTAVYICTDRSGASWMFEKINISKNYQLIEAHAKLLVSQIFYFSHNGLAKEIVTNSYETNWAGVLESPWPH